MDDIASSLRNIRDHLRTGRFGQREIWEEELDRAADEFERLRAAFIEILDPVKVAAAAHNPRCPQYHCQDCDCEESTTRGVWHENGTE
jgi:hypothetical protein